MLTPIHVRYVVRRVKSQILAQYRQARAKQARIKRATLYHRKQI